MKTPINYSETLENEEMYKYIANQLEAILDHLPGLVFYKDKENHFIRVNQYVADAYSLTKAELEGKSLFDLYSEEIAQKYYEDDLEVINSGEAKLNIEETWETTEGTRWVNTSKIPFVDDHGNIIGIIGISFDITERKENEQKIKILQQTVEQAPDAIVITETNGDICYVNNAFLKITGYTYEEAIGKNPRILKLNTQANIDYKAMWECILSGKEWHGVFQNQKKNGDEYWERSSVAPILDEHGQIIKFIGIKEDVTKEHATELELEKLYRTDVLTQLSNRRSVLELSEHEFARNKRYPQPSAFMMLDIDHFKKVNDSFGHIMGDKALVEFASVCLKTIRSTDLIGRFGGEEFVIYLINTDAENANLVAERLRNNVEKIELISDRGDKIKFTVSIGMTMPVETDADLDAVIKRADDALYTAKNKGRNRIEWLK